MRRAMAVGALLGLLVAGVAQAGGHRSTTPRAPRAGGHRHAGVGEIRPIKSLGRSEFRPYEPAKPLKPFSYLDHERRGRKGR